MFFKLHSFFVQPVTRWIDSYLLCKMCGKHLMCAYHAGWLKQELKKAPKNENCNPHKCEDC